MKLIVNVTVALPSPPVRARLCELPSACVELPSKQTLLVSPRLEGPKGLSSSSTLKYTEPLLSTSTGVQS